jgi:hypothetical protein
MSGLIYLWHGDGMMSMTEAAYDFGEPAEEIRKQ